MANAHQFNRTAYETADFGFNVISDPGANGNINLEGKSIGFCRLTGSATSRNLLPAPQGTILIVHNETAGSTAVDDSINGSITIAQHSAAILVSVDEASAYSGTGWIGFAGTIPS